MEDVLTSALALPEQLSQISTLAELLQWRASLHPERVAYRFLGDGNEEKAILTYGELHKKAALIAACLRSHGSPGERAVLLYPPGLDFICSFFGCTYANVIAVPIAPPRGSQRTKQLERITQDSSARFMLTTGEFHSRLAPARLASPSLGGMQWLETDRLRQSDAGCATVPVTASGFEATADSLAFLQYTSGSTSLPRGVMVTHRNLMHNERAIKQQYRIPNGVTFVSWLPMYHDLGLIGAIIQALYSGADCVLLSPIAFIRSPALWLEAVSRYKAFISGGPNFGYELCIRQVDVKELKAFDLSQWQVATNGAEPVRAGTIERFTEVFSQCGFRREAFNPSYGLAEATLLVSCPSIPGEGPRVRAFNQDALQQNRVELAGDGQGRRLTSVGQGFAGERIMIVDPELKVPCAPDQIGEIWVSGPSVAQGYWNNPAATEGTFHARLSTNGEGPFLRTGDLGFFSDEELYVTGRLKEMIILNGRNHYPQDIELTVESAHASLQPGCGAAFSVLIDDEEKLAIAFEVKRSSLDLDAGAVADCIRELVAKQHEAAVYDVVLVRPGTIPKTSSGKVQRALCRERYMSGTLDRLVARATAGIPSAGVEPGSHNFAPIHGADIHNTERRVMDTILAQIVSSTGRSREDLPVDKDLFSLGIDSLKGIEIIRRLEVALGVSLSPTLLFEAPTVERLAREFVARFESEELHRRLAGAETPASIPQTTENRESPEKESRTKAARHRPFQDGERVEDIAVIGMGCRLPGAPDLDSFWRLLAGARDAISEIPSERWDWVRNYDKDPGAEGKTYSKWGGFLDEIDQFDAAFFNISAREAKLMDPQQRIFLEVAWETFEQSGYSTKTLSETDVGVFVGCSNNGYYQRIAPYLKQSDYAAGVGNQNPIIANRVSFFLNLHGPSILVDTLCSSSLVAVHLACQSLRLGECAMALVGGINLLLSPEYYVAMSRMKALSPDGRCRTFDSQANGMVSGEGAGALLLKPLRQALDSGDTIHAIIKGSAVNHGGQTNGLTAPNPRAQAEVIRRALRSSGVSADSVSYVEAHGTGTTLGDPIEIAGLTQAFRQDANRKQWCAIGSVKTNVGHLEPAAGVVGVIKVALCMEHRELPASLHFETANPMIQFEQSPFYVNTALSPWNAERPRRAGVSSFGLGGANAHAILEEAAPPPAAQRQDDPLEFNLFTLSAKTDTALRALAQRYLDSLPLAGVPISDICYTVNAGRTHFSRRLALVAKSTTQIQESLQGFLDGHKGTNTGNVKLGRVPAVAFVFTGQGGQIVGLGRRLFETNAIFRQTMERCDDLIRPYLDQGLLSFLYANTSANDLDASRLQPALFALQYALTVVWCSWGVVPSFVVGHSLGEYAAACTAGIFSLEDGIKLVAERARLMHGLARKGRMAVIFADKECVARAVAPFPDLVSVAAANSARNTVISGDEATVEAVPQSLRLQGITHEPLSVSHAFHSPLMEPILDEFHEVANSVTFRNPVIPMISTVTGQMVEIGSLPDAAYWRRHTRGPVQFEESMRFLGVQDCSILLEIGPSSGLLGSAKNALARRDGIFLPSFAHGDDSLKTLLTSLGSLYAHGVEVAWSGLYKNLNCRRVPLPTYPFERQRYWVDEAQPEQRRVNIATDSPRNGRSYSETGEIPETVATTAIIPSPANQAETLSRRDSILHILRQKLAGLLEMQESEIDDGVPFLELGADSLVLLEALQGIQDVFGVKLGIRQLFEDFTNLETLARHLDERLPPDRQLLVGALDGRGAANSHVASRISGSPLAETIVTEAAPHTTSGGHHNRPHIADVLTKQLEMMHEIISRQLQILENR